MRSAAHNELGLQAVKITGDEDGDFDGVKNELSVGDLTALMIYMAGLERPVTKLELAALKLVKVTKEEERAIMRGENLFVSTGCAGCHVPEMRLDQPMFQESSVTPGFHDVLFLSGARPSNLELKQDPAVQLDLTADQSNNKIKLTNGKVHPLGHSGPHQTVVRLPIGTQISNATIWGQSSPTRLAARASRLKCGLRGHSLVSVRQDHGSMMAGQPHLMLRSLRTVVKPETCEILTLFCRRMIETQL